MFQFFPKLLYQFNDFDYVKLVDLNVSAKVSDFIKSYRGSALLRNYIVQDGDRPEMVSNKLFGTPKYDYLIMIFNDVESIYDDWPRDSKTLNNYIEKKYGSISAASVISYWFTPEGDQVSETFWNTISDTRKYTRSHYEQEVYLNDEKARINIFDYAVAVKFESGIQELFDNL